MKTHLDLYFFLLGHERKKKKKKKKTLVNGTQITRICSSFVAKRNWNFYYYAPLLFLKLRLRIL